MRGFLLIAVLFATTVSAQSLDYPSIWKCDQPKANWYCDEPEPQAVETAPVQTATQPLKRIELNQIRTAKQLRQELKRREESR